MPKHAAEKKLEPGDPGYVGRGYPPEHGKIRPGEVKNRWGRYGKKGKPAKQESQDFASAMAEQLARRVPSKDGKSYSYAELAVNGLRKGVAAGDIPSIKLLMVMHDKYLPQGPISRPDQIEASDAEILERYTRQVLLSAGLDPDALASKSNNFNSPEGEDAEDAESV